MSKVTIIGAGGVGCQLAFATAFKKIKGLKELALVDIVEGVPQGKALDLQQALAVVGSKIKVQGSNSYDISKNSDIVVVTAGLPRKPGMSREDLIGINSKIMSQIIPEVVKYSPSSILIVITNPLDAMVKLAYKLSGFPKQRVLGMAGVLDSARMKAFIAQELKTSPKKVHAVVLGSHGETMVPAISHSTVQGKPLTQVLSAEKIEAIINRTRNAGGEIINLLKTGSTIFGPGLAIAEMIQAILGDEKRVLVSSVLLQGEYGVQDLFVVRARQIREKWRRRNYPNPTAGKRKSRIRKNCAED